MDNQIDVHWSLPVQRMNVFLLHFLPLLKAKKGYSHGAAVVAQLVERSLSTSEICGSDPVISIFTINCIKMVYEDAGNGPF